MVPFRKQRLLRNRPTAYYFKPLGIPLRNIEEEVLEPDEFEALKLHDVDNLPQIQAAEKMNISQPTFARILNSTYKKIARALTNGKAIKIIPHNKTS